MFDLLALAPLPRARRAPLEPRAEPPGRLRADLRALVLDEWTPDADHHLGWCESCRSAGFALGRVLRRSSRAAPAGSPRASGGWCWAPPSRSPHRSWRPTACSTIVRRAGAARRRGDHVAAGAAGARRRSWSCRATSPRSRPPCVTSAARSRCAASTARSAAAHDVDDPVPGAPYHRAGGQRPPRRQPGRPFGARDGRRHRHRARDRGVAGRARRARRGGRAPRRAARGDGGGDPRAPAASACRWPATCASRRRRRSSSPR